MKENPIRSRGFYNALPTMVLGVLLALPQTNEATAAEIDIQGPELILKSDPQEDVTTLTVPPNFQYITTGSVLTSSISSSSTTFIVEYATPTNPLSCTGTVATWPTDAQTAFSAAANIWANLIHSIVPIKIHACWKSLGQGILGSAGAPLTGLTAPLTANGNTIVPDTFYPFPLWQALTKVDRTNPPFDIRANFNQDFSWYFGTDGMTPAGQHDFLTVVLHEIAHGLGISGAGSVSGTSGVLTFSGFPLIWDHFTKDGNGLSLMDDYASPSDSLGNALRGGEGGVFFHGSRAIAGNGGNPVPLYSPAVWNQGSSYSHLDETYNLTADDLMTFSIGPGRSQHTVGPVTLGILQDLGWPEDNDSVLTRALAFLSYDPAPDNPPLDALGTVTFDFSFTNTGTESLNNFYLLVNTANNATLNNATATTNNGGVDSRIDVMDADLPGGDSLFDPGETLTLPLVLDLSAAPFNLNFDAIATDQALASKLEGGVSLGRFAINDAVLAEHNIDLNLPSDGIAIVSQDVLATGGGAGGCAIGTGSSRLDPALPLLLALALFGIVRRRLAR